MTDSIHPPVSRSLREYARGLAGGLMFSLPLLYTMEVWWAGFVAEPMRLVLYVAATFVLLLGYNHYAGLHHDASWQEVVIDSVEEMGLGLILAAGVLFLLGQLGGVLDHRSRHAQVEQRSVTDDRENEDPEPVTRGADLREDERRQRECDSQRDELRDVVARYVPEHPRRERRRPGGSAVRHGGSALRPARVPRTGGVDSVRSRIRYGRWLVAAVFER